MKKKVLALVLALVLCISLLPTMALATVSEGDVAKIGDTGYSSFKAAMDSVQDGQTVEVLKSSTLNGMITFKKNCTVDIKEGVTVTIGTNSSIESYSMKNVEFVGKGGISVGSGPYDAVFELGNGSGVKLNLRDGVFQGKYIAECKGTGEYYVNIYGGYYNFDTALAHKNQDYYTLDVAVYGGYFTKDVSDYCAPTVKCVLLATTDPAYALGYRYTTAPVTADEAACVIMGADGGRTYCLNVSGAFAAAKSGDTIQLLADYSHSIDLATAGAFILNLGGFELTADSGCDAIIIREGIDLTVLNGTVSAPGANAFILTQNDDGMGGWLAEYYPDVASTLTLDKVTVTAGTGVMLDNDNSDALVAFKSGIVTGTSAAFAKTDRNAGGFSFVGGTFNTEPAEADVATASTKVDNGDGTWTVKPPVASITRGDVTTKYTTLDAAISAADSGDTIQILPGTITGNYLVNKSLTFIGAKDEQGNLLSTLNAAQNGNGNACLRLDRGKNITVNVKDLNFTNSDSLTSCEAVHPYKDEGGNNVANLIGCTVQTGFRYAVYYNKGWTGTVDGCTFNSAKVGVEGNNVTVKNSIFHGVNWKEAIEIAKSVTSTVKTNNEYNLVGTNQAYTKAHVDYCVIAGTYAFDPVNYVAEGYFAKKENNEWTVMKQTTKVEEVKDNPVKDLDDNDVPEVPGKTKEAVKQKVQDQTKQAVQEIVSIPEVTTMTPAETKVEEAIVTGDVNPTKIETVPTETLTPTVVKGDVVVQEPVAPTVVQDDTLESIVKKAVVANVEGITTENVGGQVTDASISKFVKVAVDSAAVEVKTETTTDSQVTVQTTVDSVIYNVKPMATTTVTVGTGDDAVTTTVTTPIPNELITSPITFRLGVPSHFEGIVKVIHRHSDNTVEEFNVPVLTGDNGKKYVELSSDNFSEWEVSMGSTTVTYGDTMIMDTSSIGEDSVEMTIENGGVLLLKGDNLDNVTVTPKNGVLATFDYDGGIDNNECGKMYAVVQGTQITPPVLQKKTVTSGDTPMNYYFTGWNSTKQPVGEKIWEDTIFTAKWTANEAYTVTLTSDAPTTGIRISEGTNVTVAVSGENWNDAKIVVSYDAQHFTLSDTHDSTVEKAVDNESKETGTATITLYGKDRVNGEVCKTLTFVGKTKHDTAPEANNIKVTSATVNTGTSAMVIDVTSVAAANLTGATVKVIAADAEIYTISLGNGLSYETDAQGAIQATVVADNPFTGKINDYDKGYTYTFKNGNNGAIANVNINTTTGEFTIASVTGSMTVTVEKKITGITAANVKVIEDYVGGYSLVLVDATGATQLNNLAYKGAVMFKADKFAPLFGTEPAATSFYAYIVKGAITPADAYKQLSVSKAAQVLIPAANTKDINASGTYDLNDVQAVWNCYNVNQVKYPMATYMAVYLRADVDASGRVDATDISKLLALAQPN